MIAPTHVTQNRVPDLGDVTQGGPTPLEFTVPDYLSFLVEMDDERLAL